MTPERALELLPEYVMGTVAEPDRRAIDALLERSPELAREADLLREAASLVAVALPPTMPNPEVRRRLLASVRQDRFLPFVDRAAELCDLAITRMQELLRLIDRPEAWEDGPFPGIRLIHFDHGPRCTVADTGFVRLPAGLEFPRHRHLGPETNMVLEGRLIDEDGTAYGPGDVVYKTVDDVHSYRVDDAADAIFLTLMDGFEFV